MVVQLRAACLARGPIRHAVCEFYKAEPEPYPQVRDHMMDDGVHAMQVAETILAHALLAERR
jgi:hypothetical protein